jgi:hypothetical protein
MHEHALAYWPTLAQAEAYEGNGFSRRFMPGGSWETKVVIVDAVRVLVETTVVKVDVKIVLTVVVSTDLVFVSTLFNFS